MPHCWSLCVEHVTALLNVNIDKLHRFSLHRKKENNGVGRPAKGRFQCNYYDVVLVLVTTS